MTDGRWTRFLYLLRKLWLWSWLVTLPVAVLFLVWASNTAGNYLQFRLKYRAGNLSVEKLGRMEARTIAGQIKSFLTPRWKAGEGLDSIHLFARESELARLNSDLPWSGREYAGASLLYPDGTVREVQVKYRGDFGGHWMNRKKSMRVKTKKGTLYGGVREFNLIVPKSNYANMSHLSYQAARRLGVLAPEARMVEVYINGKYSGVYLFVEQLGEQFLRRNSRMPGDLFVGEIVGRDKVPGVTQEVFSNPAFWTKNALNNHNPPEWNEPMKELTRAVYHDDSGALGRLLDMEAFGRFAAFITLARTAHYDLTHNWRLFFDPAMGRFEPVVWDPMGWWFRDFVKWADQQSNPMDIITSIFFERLHRDHAFLEAKHEAMERFFREGGAEFIAGVFDATGPLRASLARDHSFITSASQYLTPEEAVADLDLFRQRVLESVEGVRAAYMEAPPETSYSVNGKTLQVNLSGFAPLKYLEVELDREPQGPGCSSLGYISEGRLVQRDMSGRMAVSGRTLRLEQALFPKRTVIPPATVKTSFIADAALTPATYLFDLGCFAKGTRVLSVRAGNAAGAAEAARYESLPVYPMDGNVNIAARPVETALRWSGEVSVSGVEVVEGGLELSPGTTVRLGPGASVVVKGRLIAEGTYEKPVRFIPEREGQEPWGAVVLTGKGADGSVIRHAEFSGGSGVRYGHVEYSAMLSIHGVKGVEIDNCLFSENKIVDDMVHAVYSGVTVKDSVFLGSRADALDLDYVEGMVVDSRFIGSGNDSLDLMSSRVAVLGSVMEGSGDKGISVGEGTDVFVWDSLIKGNEIGVQAKDGSRAHLYNVELSGNKKTLDAYRKNWQYGDGGHVHAYKSVIAGEGLTADKSSSLSIYDSYIDATPEKKKRIRIDGWSGAHRGFERRARLKESFADSIELPAQLTPHLGRIDPEARGRPRQ